MIENTDLPHVLAAINITTMATLIAAYVFIRQGSRDRHRQAMLTAVALGVTFLVIYVIYHLNAGLAKFGGAGFIRQVYFTILIAHVFMAVTVVVLIPVTLFRALTGRFDKHRRIARWTLPVWLFVSATGVIVYVMAVHLFPFTG